MKSCTIQTQWARIQHDVHTNTCELEEYCLQHLIRSILFVVFWNINLVDSQYHNIAKMVYIRFVHVPLTFCASCNDFICG